MYSSARFDSPVSIRRVAETAPDYVASDADGTPPAPGPSSSPGDASAPSPDIAARGREAMALRLAMALVEGASRTSTDRDAGTSALRECGRRAAGVAPVPHDEADLVSRLHRLVRDGDRSLAEQLRLLPAFERSGLWRRAGCRDCAAWLDRELGIARVSAFERLRVARALTGLPTLEALFASGKLGWSKVRELSRVADADCEQALCAAALELSASETVELCRRWRHRRNEVADAGDGPDGEGGPRSADEVDAARALRAFDERSLTWRHRGAHTLRIVLDLPVDAGAEFLRSLECQEDMLRESDRDPGEGGDARRGDEVRDVGLDDTSDTASAPRSRTARQLRADAALQMAAKAIAHEGEAIAKADRYRVLLHLDARLLADDGVALAPSPGELPPERPTLQGFGPVAVAVAVARRIAASAPITVVTMSPSGDVVGTGASTRAWPVKMERAIRSRDRHCQMPGCTATRWTHVHHVVPVSEGGRTTEANGCLVCSSCHVCLHEGGMRLEPVSADAVDTDADTLGADAAGRDRARRFVARLQRFRLVAATGRQVAGPRPRALEPYMRGYGNGNGAEYSSGPWARMT